MSSQPPPTAPSAPPGSCAASTTSPPSTASTSTSTPGEIYGFLGPNGAGKSTTVRVLCTLITPDGGSATVAGYDVATQPEQVRLRIGVALQDAALDPKQTGIELLRLQGRLYGLNRREIATRLARAARARRHRRRHRPTDRHLLRRHEAPPRPRRRPDPQPRVLFLDEPTTGPRPGQPGARCGRRCAGSTTELGMTIFLTTQYLEEADELADRVGHHRPTGKLVAEGTPDELKRSVGDDVIIARIDGDADAAVAAVTVGRRASSSARGPRRRAHHRGHRRRVGRSAPSPSRSAAAT